MATNWTQVAMAVILFLILAVVALSATAQTGAAAGTGGGAACDLYCVMKDAAYGAGPAMCGC